MKIIDTTLLDSVSSEAKASPRLRMNSAIIATRVCLMNEETILGCISKWFIWTVIIIVVLLVGVFFFYA